MKSIDNEQLIDYYNNNSKRKLQDLFPFHSTLVGLNGVYVTSDDGKSFYVNTPCIVASNKTIIKDETYLLIDLEIDDPQIEEYRVKLPDAFYYDGSVNLLVQDIETIKKRVVTQFLERPMDICPWFLFDLDYLHKTLKSAKDNILKMYHSNRYFTLKINP